MSASRPANAHMRVAEGEGDTVEAADRPQREMANIGGRNAKPKGGRHLEPYPVPITTSRGTFRGRSRRYDCTDCTGKSNNVVGDLAGTSSRTVGVPGTSPLTKAYIRAIVSPPHPEQRRLLQTVVEKAAWKVLRHSNRESYRKEKGNAGSGREIGIWLPERYTKSNRISAP